MSEIIARRCFVSGRVQGVFYRASTRQKAVELGCTGYARNLSDGRVEVLAVAMGHEQKSSTISACPSTGPLTKS